MLVAFKQEVIEPYRGFKTWEGFAGRFSSRAFANCLQSESSRISKFESSRIVTMAPLGGVSFAV